MTDKTQRSWFEFIADSRRTIAAAYVIWNLLLFALSIVLAMMGEADAAAPFAIYFGTAAVAGMLLDVSIAGGYAVVKWAQRAGRDIELGWHELIGHSVFSTVALFVVLQWISQISC